MQTKHKHNKYNIDIKTERNFWMNNIINKWIKIEYNVLTVIKYLLN